MNKTTKYSLLIAGMAIIIATGCKKDNVPPTAPSVTTAALTNITTTSATSGGTITSDGGSAITASGIVWSKTNTTPALATDSVKSGTTASGSFTNNLTGLDFNTTYYIRAYATNSVGTGYGAVVTLNTTNDTTKVRFIYNGVQVIYGVISNTSTGRKWMDRNLGATQVATSLTDTNAYGHLFQWGRLADGHQVRTSGKVAALSSTDNPGHSNFIVPNGLSPYNDWRDPQNNNLWQGSSGINNPCPTGWHVPTKNEWDAETGITDPNSALNVLKLTYNGARSRLSGNLSGVGLAGNYWSSTIETTNAYEYSVYPSLMGTASSQRGLGAAVRCIKD